MKSFLVVGSINALWSIADLLAGLYPIAVANAFAGGILLGAYVMNRHLRAAA